MKDLDDMMLELRGFRQLVQQYGPRSDEAKEYIALNSDMPGFSERAEKIQKREEERDEVFYSIPYYDMH